MSQSLEVSFVGVKLSMKNDVTLVCDCVDLLGELLLFLSLVVDVVHELSVVSVTLLDDGVLLGGQLSHSFLKLIQLKLVFGCSLVLELAGKHQCLLLLLQLVGLSLQLRVPLDHQVDVSSK